MLRLHSFVRHSSCHLSILLSAATVLAPVAATNAQDAATSNRGAVSKAYLTPQSIAALSLRPQQILTNPSLSLLPIEVAEAASQKYLGVPATSIKSVVVVGEPLLGTTPFYAAFLESDSAWDLSKLHSEVVQHTTQGEVAGRACLISDNPMAPSFMVLKNNTLLAASPGMMEKLLQREKVSPDSVLLDLISRRDSGDDFYAAVDLQTLRPLINMGLMQPRQQTPREFDKFYDIPMYLQSAELALNLDGLRASQLVVHTATDSDADALEQLLSDGVDLFRAKMREGMDQQMAQLRVSTDPVERATAAYMERLSGEYTAMFVPKRNGTSFGIFDTQGSSGQQMGSVAIIGIMVALLLPAVQAAREAARRNQSMNNMKQLMLALLNFESTRGTFPAHATYSEEGKPLLSWRVQILPYIEQQELYDQFRHDEPWDSDHNKQLIASMPQVFIDPSSPKYAASDGYTHYLGVKGKGFLFDSSFEEQQLKSKRPGRQIKGNSFRGIQDGSSNTLAFVQVNDQRATIWTKPDDWEMDTKNPLNGLSPSFHPGIFLAAFCDGHVAPMAQDIDADTLKAMCTRNGREAPNAP